MKNPRPTSARLLTGLAPFLLVGLSLPLLAPSCGDFQPGVKTFAKGSLVIPMDVCYQCTRQSADGLDTATASCTKTGYTTASGVQCPQALSKGDVIKAYGLVYQLIRSDVAVYWVIDPQKAKLDGYDLAIQYDGGFPVLELDWATGLPGASPTAAAKISYMGGPFVVDGSDAAKAIAVMKANQAAFGTVNVHVANVAFQASVAKTMAGGWSAGGAVAPKLALLDIGSGNLSLRTSAPSSTCDTSSSASCVKDASGTSWTCLADPKNAEPVIRQYLAMAGIGTGTAGGTAAGPHGEIYDRLGLADFQPAPGSTDWKTSAFGQGGYQILWVPHWVAPGSCSDYSSACKCLGSRYTAAQVAQVLQTVGAFSAAGGDVFAECAGLGSFEGAFSGLTSTNYTADYQDGDPSTRFQTRTGVRYNQLPTNPFPAASYTPDGLANFASPLLQLGDFPFKPYTGAIEDYKPDDTTDPSRNYQPGVTRLIGTKYASGSPSVTRDWDFFTFRDRATGHGSVVYLAGHSYSGVQGSFQVGGSRLVLNTLFNLGAGCTASGVACDTGLLGACSKGVLTCDAAGNRVCTPVNTPQPEICNGIDDNCNGLVDENLEQGCYDGPPGTQGVGQCRAGVQTCQLAPDGTYGYSACQGEVLPSPEVCNGLDDDCNGAVDELAKGPPLLALSESCYSGPAGTLGVGICTAGTRTCTSGAWGACAGEVTPVADPCATPEGGALALDRNCDGKLDQCGQCTAGQVRDCYDGPAGSAGVGLCHAGTQTCTAAGDWTSPCVGEVVPTAEICNDGLDQNCNGMLDDGPPYCVSCQFKPSATDPTKPDLATTEKVGCWTGPAGAVFKADSPASVCVPGFQFCQASGQFGPCEQQTLPGPELCNGRDDNCNGQVDEGAQCGDGFSCQNGVCVESACDGVEKLCREGYFCFGGACIVTTCGATGGACAPGNVCNGGTCSDPCDPSVIKCGTGSTCAGGYCTGGACYAVGCPEGQLCQNGGCVADRCSGVLCPSGTFCRQGDCVQACAIVTCGAGEKCGADGFCVADPCAGKSCSPSQTCVAGACQADLCVGTACGAGQVCQAGVCVDDPCTGVACPVGQCRDGQCYATNHPLQAAAEAAQPKGGCGGCGGGSSGPLALLGVLLALPLARRRRAPPGRGARGAALLAVLVAAGLASTGCTKKAAPFDPASCALLTPPLATCELEGHCVDFFNDPSHCGGCGQACGAGYRCVPGVTSGQCVPASAVAPRLSSVTPPAGSVGGLAPVALLLSGDRFAAGATLRATVPAGDRSVTVPTERQADGRLKALLDLSTAAAGTWQLRVANPDLVISNAIGFGVTIPTPAIGQVVPVPDASPGSSPAKVAAGGQAVLRLVGTGLMISSACKISSATLAETEVPATLTALGLECSLDLTAIPPGSYQVRVINDPSHASTAAPFEVVSGAPVLDSIAPSILSPGSPSGVTLFGAGFDVTSKAWFSGTGVTAAPLNTTFVSSSKLAVALVDLTTLCGAAPCPLSSAGVQYFLEVRNGALASARQEVTVASSGGAVVSTMSPGSGWQGDLLAVTISGSGFPAATTAMEYRRPGSATFTQAPTVASTATAFTGTIDLVGAPPGSAPAGSWDVRLRFGPSGPWSNAFSLRVDSNQAVVTATPSPAGGVAGSSVPVVLSVNNLRPDSLTPPLTYGGVKVRFYDPTPPAAPAVPFTTDLATVVPTNPDGSPRGTVQAVLPLAGLQTKVYAVSVVNPNGALPSSPYNFTVLPGRPSVTGVVCTSVTGGAPGCTTATSARLQDAPVPVRITGSNFAKPDLAGLNGSEVRVSSAALGVLDQRIDPASVTVTSATQIDVQLDTRQAVPGSYDVSVWNQGGALRSTPLPAAFTILP